MHLVAPQPGLALFCLLLTCANAQINSDALWFQPDVTITKFQSTLNVPALSSGAGAHAIWPGLENGNGSFVFQNVVTDNGAGQWEFFIEYCCDPNFESTPITVYPGDSITSTFTLNSAATWTNFWSLTPGSTGAAAGLQAQSGSLSNNFASEGTLDKAVLAIELQSGAIWDFGMVLWTNLAITASTVATDWCTNYAPASTTGGFSYAVSGTTTSTSGGSVTCSYSAVLFDGPS